MIPLVERFSRGTPVVMMAMYGRLALLDSLCSPLVSTFAVFEGDFPLGDSSESLFPLHIFNQLTPIDHHFNNIPKLECISRCYGPVFYESYIIFTC